MDLHAPTIRKGITSKFLDYLDKIPINVLLYSIILLILINVIGSIISRVIMENSIKQTRIAEHAVFEIDYAHDWTVRHVDVSMRGFAIIQDESYLYRSNEFIRIDLENNFKRLDSLLQLQGYNDSEGLKAIEKYKATMRNFVIYHGEMIKLLKAGKREEFLKEFRKDIGAYFWPIYSAAMEAVYKFESNLTRSANERYRFFSAGVVYLQVFTFLISSSVVLLVFQKLEKKKVMEKLLEERKLFDERNKIKETMLSMMSHEIRTPLNSMIGLTHVLGKRDPRPDQKEIINTLEASGDHLIHIVNDILDYNKIQANRLGLELSPFNLSDILRQIHSMFFRMADEKNISFSVQVDSGMPLNITGDSTRLIQILSNLIGNAMKFTSSGSVNLHVRPIQITNHSVKAEFVVADTGIGISSDIIDTIFQPFSQEKDIHRKYGGTGLGLVIVKNLVELMEGKVTVNSVYGKGATFTATIPFEISQDNSGNIITSENLKDAKHSLRGKKILYIEDVESNRFLINSLFEDYSVECHNAENAKEALDCIQKTKFDLILLDIQLPDLNGFKVANSIRTDQQSKNKETPIILFSAFTNILESDVRECRANDFINKPFKPEELISKMQKAILKDI
ncbi:MAG: response regulator [Bacteroidetes bacterium]|nr:response regulator [Bacteroidota bacterium]